MDQDDLHDGILHSTDRVLQNFLDADLSEVSRDRSLSGYENRLRDHEENVSGFEELLCRSETDTGYDSRHISQGGRHLSSLCEQLRAERDEAREEARQAAVARDAALDACTRLASMGPNDRLSQEVERLISENQKLQRVCQRLQAAGAGPQPPAPQRRCQSCRHSPVPDVAARL